MSGLRAFSRAEIESCRDHGECCQCGVCCFAYRVVVPTPGLPPGGETMVKTEGAICPYQVINPEGAYDCVLFGRPERPEACCDWRGDESYSNLMVMVQFRLVDPGDEMTVKGLGEFARSGALALLGDRVGDRLSVEDLELLLHSHLHRLHTKDSAVLEIAGVNEALEALQRRRPRAYREIVDRLALQSDDPVHREFQQRYLTGW